MSQYTMEAGLLSSLQIGEDNNKNELSVQWLSSGKKSGVAPFPLRLYEILQTEDPNIISWSGDGTAFQIRSKEAMSSKILPKYFSNNNFSSFQRQLNYFGFRKWSKFRSPICTYSREDFERGNLNGLKNIKRRTSKNNKDSPTHDEPIEISVVHVIQPSINQQQQSSRRIYTETDCESARDYLSDSPTCVSNYVLPPSLAPVKRRRYHSDFVGQSGFQSLSLLALQSERLLSLNASSSSDPASTSEKDPISITLPEISLRRQQSCEVKLPSVSTLVHNTSNPLSPWRKRRAFTDTQLSRGGFDDIYKDFVALSRQPLHPCQKDVEDIPVFLRNLFRMVSSEDCEIIRWVKDGTAFEITDSEALSEVCLPKYFKHKKISSLQRQLNMYGFRKWTKSRTNACTYSHPHFLQSSEESLRLIKRKTNPTYSSFS